MGFKKRLQMAFGPRGGGFTDGVQRAIEQEGGDLAAQAGLGPEVVESPAHTAWQTRYCIPSLPTPDLRAAFAQLDERQTDQLDTSPLIDESSMRRMGGHS